jgi:hypothetical protein
MAERVVPAMLQFAMDVAQEFTPEELQTLLELLTRLQSHIEELDANGRT